MCDVKEEACKILFKSRQLINSEALNLLAKYHLFFKTDGSIEQLIIKMGNATIKINNLKTQSMKLLKLKETLGNKQNDRDLIYNCWKENQMIMKQLSNYKDLHTLISEECEKECSKLKKEITVLEENLKYIGYREELSEESMEKLKEKNTELREELRIYLRKISVYNFEPNNESLTRSIENMKNELNKFDDHILESFVKT